MKEQWLPVANFPNYAVSTFGRIRSTKRSRGASAIDGILKPFLGRKGYLVVDLCDCGRRRTVKVHTLVLETFVGPRPDRLQARHLDDVKTNNRLDNLVWGTAKENAADRDKHGRTIIPHAYGEESPRAVLTVEQVKRVLADDRPAQVIGSELGVSRTTINDIKCGRTWRHLCLSS